MPPSSHPSGSPEFPTTRWTLIARVRKGGEKEAGEALEELCRSYWYPIYVFARRSGFPPPDAEDLTQVFFQQLITSETIQAARQERGRLRNFLLAVLKRVIGKHLRHESAEKRGGGRKATISFDQLDAEERYALEPAGVADPDRLFDRAWAEELLAAAGEKLRSDFARADNLEAFETLQEYLPQGRNLTPYPEAARRLGIAEATLRLQIHRMRKRYARLIEEEIAQTVPGPEEVKAELAHLMDVICG